MPKPMQFCMMIMILASFSSLGAFALEEQEALGSIPPGELNPVSSALSGMIGKEVYISDTNSFIILGLLVLIPLVIGIVAIRSSFAKKKPSISDENYNPDEEITDDKVDSYFKNLGIDTEKIKTKDKVSGSDNNYIDKDYISGSSSGPSYDARTDKGKTGGHYQEDEPDTSVSDALKGSMNSEEYFEYEFEKNLDDIHKIKEEWENLSLQTSIDDNFPIREIISEALEGDIPKSDLIAWLSGKGYKEDFLSDMIEKIDRMKKLDLRLRNINQRLWEMYAQRRID